jgi:hypothetical protein
VECEALSQKLILDIVRSRLEELLPESLSSVLFVMSARGTRSPFRHSKAILARFQL